jgi:hypothetical protein
MRGPETISLVGIQGQYPPNSARDLLLHGVEQGDLTRQRTALSSDSTTVLGRANVKRKSYRSLPAIHDVDALDLAPAFDTPRINRACVLLPFIEIVSSASRRCDFNSRYHSTSKGKRNARRS